MTPLIAIAIGLGVMVLLMTTLWLIQRSTHNAGIVDIAWSFGTGLLGVWFAVVAEGPVARRLLVGGIAGVWGLRLGFYLLKRVLGEEEDRRYCALREQWGERTQLYLFGFFQMQAAWAVMFALPMYLAASADRPALDVRDFIGLAIAAMALGGEAMADAQLARFRSDPSNAGGICRVGLWSWSRHPNYFFEWTHWWAYVAIGFSLTPLGWCTLAGPAVMLFFLLKVTGIPPLEERMRETRGAAFEQYARETSVFIPLPPRRSESSS